ncbi:hypothetical protein QE152_g26622 [Popillia japonica]|uniref:Uncharacterized protein n=1 Tax=Popillia japonica TaxID=7064 RepID=A0AAW1JWY4_POPJA
MATSYRSTPPRPEREAIAKLGFIVTSRVVANIHIQENLEILLSRFYCDISRCGQYPHPGKPGNFIVKRIMQGSERFREGYSVSEPSYPAF